MLPIIKDKLGIDPAIDKVSLADFLSFQSLYYKMISDVHWNKYTDLCQPCLFNYDFVYKLETNDFDKLKLFKYLQMEHPDSLLTNLPEISVFNPSRQVAPSPVKDLPELRNVSSEILSQLYNVYKDDFEMFGYSFRNHRGVCEDKEGDNCC